MDWHALPEEHFAPFSRLRFFDRSVSICCRDGDSTRLGLFVRLQLSRLRNIPRTSTPALGVAQTMCPNNGANAADPRIPCTQISLPPGAAVPTVEQEQSPILLFGR